MSFLDKDIIDRMGFLSVGQNVRLSEHASFHGASRLSIGDNVRIDDFCVLSAGAGGIRIGKNVHLAAFTSLMGAGSIHLDDYSGLSARVSIYSSSDDYSGAAMTNPTVPTEFTNVFHADVYVGKHVIVGCGSVVMPGVRLEEGVVIGALSFVDDDCMAFGIYAGVPVRRIKERRRDFLKLEHRFEKLASC